MLSFIKMKTERVGKGPQNVKLLKMRIQRPLRRNIFVALTGVFNKIEYFYKGAANLPSFFCLASLNFASTQKICFCFQFTSIKSYSNTTCHNKLLSKDHNYNMEDVTGTYQPEIPFFYVYVPHNICFRKQISLQPGKSCWLGQGTWLSTKLMKVHVKNCSVKGNLKVLFYFSLCFTWC